MRFELDPRHLRFREEVRGFLAENLPPELVRRRAPISYNGRYYREDTLQLMQILDRRGWSVPTWPARYGGQDWDPFQKFIFHEELDRADAPPFNVQATALAGPVIYTFGTDEQKARFLPGIREGQTYWCQGFSEPGAGSDLASLRTRAERRGDHYLVTGQKIWTSGAHHSDWGFFLVRTSVESVPQKGISFLLIDMKSPGITVRPIPQINGDAHLCEVFLDGVEVPAENLVGEEGAGWNSAKFLLDHERTSSAFIFSSKRELRRLKAMAADPALRPAPGFAERLARVEAQLLALEWSVLRVLADDLAGRNATAVASALKVRGADLQQALMTLQLELVGEGALRLWSSAELADPAPGPLWPASVPGRTASALITRAASIYGGTRQVQLNIIAKTAFGL